MFLDRELFKKRSQTQKSNWAVLLDMEKHFSTRNHTSKMNHSRIMKQIKKRPNIAQITQGEINRV